MILKLCKHRSDHVSKLGLITYHKAKEEIELLEKYVDLIENYEIKNVEQFIIKNYAITNSSSKVIKEFHIYNSKLIYPPLSREYILAVIKGPTLDELHQILKKAYYKKYIK